MQEKYFAHNTWIESKKKEKDFTKFWREVAHNAY